MPFNDRQEKTLVYRVELDESSVAQSIRTARETVGVGLSQAVDQAAAIGHAVNVTAATAAARVGGHLEFMERTRQVLAAPEETRNAAHGMGVMRALGVKAGVVSPRFSETAASLESRADRELLGDPTGVKGMQRTSAIANLGMFAAGIGLMFTGVGAVPGALLTVGSVASSMGVDIGMDRAIMRRQLAGHMSSLGMQAGLEVTNEFERYINQQKVSFRDAMEVGEAALTSIPRSQLGNRARVRDTLVSAVETWGMVGKAWGMEKEDSLSAVTELYRLGIDPMMLRGSSYIGGIANLSRQFGINPAAMNSASMDVMRSAMVGGYDAMTAGNLFQLQTNMIASMTRSGVLTRGDLAQAAGFSGPQAEMQIAAAQKLMAAGMQFRETGAGMAINAGLMMGGQGNYMDLISQAGAMTTQQMLEYRVNAPRSGNMQEQNLAVVNMVRDIIQKSGGEATSAAIQGQLMNLGYDSGTARMLARITPVTYGVSSASAMTGNQASWEQGNERAGFLGYYAGKAGSTLGDFGEDLGRYGRGYGRAAAMAWDNTVGSAWRTLWSNWEIDPVLGFQTGVATARSAPSIMSEREMRRMSPEARRRMRATEDSMMSDYQRLYVKSGRERFSMQGFQQYVNDQLRRDLGHWADAEQPGGVDNRNLLTKDVNYLKDEYGVSLNDDQMLSLVPIAERFRKELASTHSADGQRRLFEDTKNKILAMQTLGLNNESAQNVMEFMGSDRMRSRVTDPEFAARLIEKQSFADWAGTKTAILGDKELRTKLAGRLFAKDSASYKELAESDKVMTESDVIAMAKTGFNKGDINQAFMKKFVGGGMNAAERAVEEAMTQGAPELSEKTASAAKQKADKEAAAKERSDDLAKGFTELQADLLNEQRATNRMLKDLIDRGQIAVATGR